MSLKIELISKPSIMIFGSIEEPEKWD